MASVEKAVKYMEEIAEDDTHGYSQSSRGGNPDFDCSSLVSKAFNQAGFDIKLGSTTRNLYDQFIKCGFKDVKGSTPKRGDVLLKVGHHVVVCTDKDHIVHASINELGKAIGGRKGDQTGKEICVRDYYTYRGGWDYQLRFEESKKEEKKVTETPISYPTYKVGKIYKVLKQRHIYVDTDLNSRKLKYNEFTANAKSQDKNKDGLLDKGASVTCKAVKIVDGRVWMKIPSGWVVAFSKKGVKGIG